MLTLRVLCLAMALAAATGVKAQSPSVIVSSAAAMQWVDLRSARGPLADYQRGLWRQNVEASDRQWKRSKGQGPLPAFLLIRSMRPPEVPEPTVVSILFDMFDCELPANGTGASLYARCPMKVVRERAQGATVQEIPRVCMLYVPPVSAGEGPDPAANFTQVVGTATGLNLSVVEHGIPVPACDLTIPSPR